jgi:hypothetical protein
LSRQFKKRSLLGSKIFPEKFLELFFAIHALVEKKKVLGNYREFFWEKFFEH